MQVTTIAQHLGLAALVAVMAVGCSSTPEQPAQPTTVVDNRPEPVKPAAPEPKPAADNAAKTVPNDQYKVVRGDSLWRISGRKTVYGNPYQWPLIYKANRNMIKDADLIFPGQNFAIDRNADAAAVNAAVKHAKTRGAWKLGKVEASDTRYLNQK